MGKGDKGISVIMPLNTLPTDKVEVVVRRLSQNLDCAEPAAMSQLSTCVSQSLVTSQICSFSFMHRMRQIMHRHTREFATGKELAASQEEHLNCRYWDSLRRNTLYAQKSGGGKYYYQRACASQILYIIYGFFVQKSTSCTSRSERRTTAGALRRAWKAALRQVPELLAPRRLRERCRPDMQAHRPRRCASHDVYSCSQQVFQ